MSTGGERGDWTRRRLLAVGCAALGAASLGEAVAADAGRAADDKDGAYGPFKMGLQSYSLRGFARDGHPDTERALAVTRELGVHYWEAFPAHLPLMKSPQQIAERK